MPYSIKITHFKSIGCHGRCHLQFHALYLSKMSGKKGQAVSSTLFQTFLLNLSTEPMTTCADAQESSLPQCCTHEAVSQVRPNQTPRYAGFLFLQIQFSWRVRPCKFSFFVPIFLIWVILDWKERDFDNVVQSNPERCLCQFKIPLQFKAY